MKIEFLTMDDPLYILPFFDEFVRKYAGDFEITQVSLCRTMGKRSRTKLVRELMWLYGFFGFVRLSLETVVGRVLAVLPKNRAASRFHTIPQLCRTYGITCTAIENPNDPGFVESVRQRGADVLVSVACPYILKDALLGTPPKGCVNIHHAPLPRYKGMMPTFWQMFHGEESVGVTVHYMVPKIDEGRALVQETLQRSAEESLDSLIRRSKRHGAHCMAKALKQIENGTAQPVALDQEKGSYFTFPTESEIREFHRKGLRAI